MQDPAPLRELSRVVRDGQERVRMQENLTKAVRDGNRCVAKAMLEKYGADPNQTMVHGKTARAMSPLFVAIEANDAAMTRMLLKNGAMANLRSFNMVTPLAWAIDTHCNPDIVKDVLRFGARVNDKVESMLPVELLVRNTRFNASNNGVAAMKVLLNAESTATDRCMQLAVAHAASHAMIRVLLERGGNPNATDKQGNTLLMQVLRISLDSGSLRQDKALVAHTLIDNGARVDAMNATNETATGLALQLVTSSMFSRASVELFAKLCSKPIHQGAWMDVWQAGLDSAKAAVDDARAAAHDDLDARASRVLACLEAQVGAIPRHTGSHPLD